ncbi:hypothetical protein EAS64_28035 [Trebonia kvetii]|uniref:Uncharacterized protein n=1 Tax=Trebonia kvetii TaxID=2480626 RepID=A0A6P2BUA6_9ACTN|nr:hypothetical protein EAS64_28035 [Trebonia kvetii]
MPPEEPRRLVKRLVGLVQFAEPVLEHVRCLPRHVQRHLDVIARGIGGEAHRVVEQDLMGAGLE